MRFTVSAHWIPVKIVMLRVCIKKAREVPENAEVVVDTDKYSVEECVEQIVSALEEYGVFYGGAEGLESEVVSCKL